MMQIATQTFICTNYQVKLYYTASWKMLIKMKTIEKAQKRMKHQDDSNQKVVTLHTIVKVTRSWLSMHSFFSIMQMLRISNVKRNL